MSLMATFDVLDGPSRQRLPVSLQTGPDVHEIGTDEDDPKATSAEYGTPTALRVLRVHRLRLLAFPMRARSGGPR